MRSRVPVSVLISVWPDDPEGLRGWVLYHLALGFREVVLYGAPPKAHDAADLAPIEASRRLVRRPLDLDAGPPLKSAMACAVRSGHVPEGGWAIALGAGEYLTLSEGGEGCLAELPLEGCAALCLPVSGRSGEVRTLFRGGSFGGHDGARPIRPRPGDAPVWRDARGAVIDPDETFWSPPAPGPDAGPSRIVALHDGGDPRCAALRARTGALARRADLAGAEGIRKLGLQEAVPEAPDARARPGPVAEIAAGEGTHGFHRRLAHQSLVHIDRPSDRLVVTFDNLSAVNDMSPDRVPWGYKFLREAGCAHLGVLAHRKDWYREPGLIAALEALRDEGLFAQYRDVIFTGTSMGGFAALAFSSLAPGARVLAFSPQSTLDEAIVPWETRFGMGRMRNWRLPYSDAAFEIEPAAEVIVISDPYFDPDQRHVDRLKTPNVTRLKAWYSGHFSPVFLRRADLLKPVMAKMIHGALTQEAFYRLYRGRRQLPWYKRSLQEALETRGRRTLASRVGPAFHRARRATGT